MAWLTPIIKPPTESKTMHTPGPWHMEVELGQIAGYIHNDNGDDTGRAICDLRPGARVKHNDKRRTDSFVFNETDLANARLIAAAPDLLNALEKCRAWVAQYHDQPGHDAASKYMTDYLDKIISTTTGE
jgi:hypothetical protein